MKSKGPKVLLVTRAIIINEKDQVLLYKRKDDISYHPLKWELPGGKIPNGSSLEEGTLRKIDQETGLYVSLSSDSFIAHNRIITEKKKYQGYHYLEVAIPAKHLAGKPRVNDKDHIKGGWVALSDALTLDLSLPARRALTQYIFSQERSKNSGKYHNGMAIPVARAVIRNENNEILLLQRANDKNYGGKWEIPGGKMDSFEHLDISLQRETLEETGLVVDITTPNIYTFSLVRNEGKYSGVTFINILSECRVKAGTLTLSREHQDHGWFSPKEALKLELAEYIHQPFKVLYDSV